MASAFSGSNVNGMCSLRAISLDKAACASSYLQPTRYWDFVSEDW